MEKPQIPSNEAQRLAALHATSLLGSEPEEAFDRITRLAARVLDMPMVQVSLIGKDMQWYKSFCGYQPPDTTRENAFCAHAILTDEPMVVPDAALDPRFARNPLVTGDPHVRFYAGVQLYTIDRMKLGTLCVMDRRPRAPSTAEMESLSDLARMVEQLIHHRQLAMATQELHRQLRDDAQRTALPPAAAQVDFLLTHDVLTGLANRNALLRAIHDGIAGWRGGSGSGGSAGSSGDGGSGAIVAWLNIDKFKRLNQVLGHRGADQTLVDMSTALQQRLRDGDMLARAGGDEFGFLLRDPGSDAQTEELLASLVQAANRRIKAGDDEINVTCSIGYARFPQHGEDADALLNHAASAMRHAKTLGGGHVGVFSTALPEERGRRLTLESHLHRAVAQGELFLQYQPKIDVRSGRVAGFEALLRWRHPDYGVIPPDEFIPIAEETGLIVPIGDWIMHTVMAQLGAWQQDGMPALPVAVNLSARQFMQTDVVKITGDFLRANGIAPALLELELTESVSMADPTRSAVVMRQLRALGVALSIDDFGTGYSSFAYLKRLPIDKLKIDRSFIQDMCDSEEALAIVEAVIVMAHRLHLEVIAEGVETEAQAQALRHAGCDQIQGYFYSRPLLPGDCRAFVRQRHEDAGTGAG